MATWQGVVNEPGTTISCNGFGVTLTATDVTTQGGSDGAISSTVAGGTTPYTYNWSNGQATPSLSGLFAGTYSLTVTDAYGCVATATAVVNDGQAPSYVQDNTLQRTKVFPVPAREQLVIQTGLNKPVEYQIINPLGQTVVKGYVVSQKNVDVSQLARGSYILSLNNNTDYHKIKITLIK
ncbi:MAG: T9SS C-terminal target domain-containing protein [Bacteroidetes bacterium]|nr:MAG: T9SS C-terminal target domain-containing protein [Bacteroidota bacterium]